MRVGFFDSGIGGMCIVEAFRELCPDEEIIYLADSENCPYGNRSAEEVKRLSEACVKRLLRHGCKIIVIACNTATAAAIGYLRERYPEVTFVGIEPAIKPAALKSQSGVIGVLATRGTLNGGHYRATRAKYAGNVRVVSSVADEFVAAVEAGELEGEKVERMVRRRLKPLLDAGADKIVLGCTHFPHLKKVIEKVLDGRADIVDPSRAVARQAARLVGRMRGKEEK